MTSSIGSGFPTTSKISSLVPNKLEDFKLVFTLGCIDAVRYRDSHPEAGSYLRLIHFVYRSTLGLRVIKKKEEKV